MHSQNGDPGMSGVAGTNGDAGMHHTNGDVGMKAELKSDQPPTEKNIPQPMKLFGALDNVESFRSTPCIGTEFPKVNLAELLRAPNSDELIHDLAVTSIIHLFS